MTEDWISISHWGMFDPNAWVPADYLTKLLGCIFCGAND